MTVEETRAALYDIGLRIADIEDGLETARRPAPAAVGTGLTLVEPVTLGGAVNPAAALDWTDCDLRALVPDGCGLAKLGVCGRARRP